MGNVRNSSGAFLAVLFLFTQLSIQDGGGESIDGGALEVGDIAVSGVLTDDGQCVFEEFTISTLAPEEEGEGASWIGLELDDQCRFIVDAKWVGTLEEGPSSKVDPLLELMKYEAELNEEEPSSGTLHSVSLLAGCKSSYQHVWMYGLGGSWDQLTHKSGRLYFCYNGSTATIDSQSGTCAGSNLPGWNWVVDSCPAPTVVSGPAASVSRSGRGNYHCNPPAQAPCNTSNPDGYYHTLRETEIGHANGNSSCTFSYSGVIAAGVTREILQGC